jgi:hypothetical protein
MSQIIYLILILLCYAFYFAFLLSLKYRSTIGQTFLILLCIINSVATPGIITIANISSVAKRLAIGVGDILDPLKIF